MREKIRLGSDFDGPRETNIGHGSKNLGLRSGGFGSRRLGPGPGGQEIKGSRLQREDSGS